jgi:cellulose synthase/poly-beta-1,6-N-acetylglucosamine synthase-like glycosyltransferase
VQAIAYFICWGSLIGILIPYLFYPAILAVFVVIKIKLLGARKPRQPDFQPNLSVLLAVYNEAAVIEKKIRNVFALNYSGQIELLIGSDASTDETNAIITRLQTEFGSRLRLIHFTERTGKPGIINQLVPQAAYQHLLLTDAKAMFASDTAARLLPWLAEHDIGLVSARILNQNSTLAGISRPEKTHFSLESWMKYAESELAGAMMGAFGTCYAISKADFSPTPPRFICDDFYITMQILVKGKRAWLEPSAICYQNVSQQSNQEFRRKTRIAMGNFQNMVHFRYLLLPHYGAIALFLACHKVLRWLTPFFLVLSPIAAATLGYLNTDIFYYYLAGAQLATPALTLPADTILQQFLRFNLLPLRFVTHFYTMNAALLYGFYRYLQGVNSNIWQPTQRSSTN